MRFLSRIGISEDHPPAAIASLVANLNSYVLDFIAQQKVGGANLNFFILRQFAVLTPESYEARCPWSLGETLADWLTPKVQELTYIAWDLQSFAKN